MIIQAIILAIKLLFAQCFKGDSQFNHLKKSVTSLSTDIFSFWLGQTDWILNNWYSTQISTVRSERLTLEKSVQLESQKTEVSVMRINLWTLMLLASLC